MAYKDYSCIITPQCPTGKTCITSSSGREYIETISWDIPGNDIVQFNNLKGKQYCADKCEATNGCRAFLFLKENTIHHGVYGRCWLKTKISTDSGLS